MPSRGLALAALLMLGAVGPAFAEERRAPQATVPLPPPEPPARPDELKGPPPHPLPAGAPLPPERPAELSPPVPAKPDEAAAPVKEAPLPPGRPPELSGDAGAALAAKAPDDTACLRRLERLGVAFGKRDPIVNGQCSVARPLAVTALRELPLAREETMTCTIAEALARWATEVAVVAETELGDRLTGLSLGGAYQCRGQNHGAEARLSEHAFANAVDVMGFTFARHPPIAVGFLPAGTPEAAFLAEVRRRACPFFRTVLGPGSNEAHANHLHLDERERNGGQRLCEL